MDTKSTKIRHSLSVKAICVLLSVAMLFMSAYFAAEALGAGFMFGTKESINGVNPAFEDCSAFVSSVNNDVYGVAFLAKNSDTDILEKELAGKKEEAVNTTVSRYLTERAKIIEKELCFVATSYDTQGDVYDDIYDEIVVSTTVNDAVTEPSTQGQTSTEAVSEGVSEATVTEAQINAACAHSEISIDPKAPKNVQVAQAIVSKTSGLDYLQYDYLVRSEAFHETSFSPDYEITLSNDETVTFGAYDSEFSDDYDMDADEAKTDFSSEYDEFTEHYISNQKESKAFYEARLEGLVNFKYAALDNDGNVLLTNMGKEASAISSTRNHDCWFVYSEGKTASNGMADMSYGYDISEMLKAVGAKNIRIYAFVEDKLAEGDKYFKLSSYYNECKDVNIKNDIIISVAALAAAITFLMFVLCLCGHKNGAEGITLSFIDYLSGDVHAVLSVAAITALSALAVFLAETYVSFCHVGSYNEFSVTVMQDSIEFGGWIIVGIAASCAAAWVLFIEWFTSVVRSIKSDKPFFKRFLTVKLVLLVWHFIRFIFRKIKKLFSALSYKPGKFKKSIIWIFIGFFVLDFVLLAIGTSLFDSSAASLIFFALAIALNCFALYRVLRYFKSLDKIIVSAADKDIIITDIADMPESLKSLAESIQIKQDELQRAVSRAVKDERTKTELITNVSHDLKTPLTAVISYVDLLKKCDITDETALGYINVLDEKSIKLKRLIEDLIEASKVSTGNITLSPVAVNFNELAVQAIGEMNDDFEERGLEIRFSEPSDPPIILADSQKTFRIIDNLLNNARKYSATGSRVYVTVSKDCSYGIFEVKNISCEPLNITPSELTERFVRGDASRTNEGNGLGLSIAKDLCRIQNGELEITIDGDLFKATVYLPLKK